MPTPAPIATDSHRQRLKLLVWPLLLALLFGFGEFGGPAEDVLRIARNGLHQNPVSGNIVLVEID